MKLRGSLWTGHVAKNIYFESIQNFVGKSRGTLLFGRLRWKWKINWTWITQKSTAKCLGRLMASRWRKITEFCVDNFENSGLVSEVTHFILKLPYLGTGLKKVPALSWLLTQNEPTSHIYNFLLDLHDRQQNQSLNFRTIFVMAADTGAVFTWYDRTRCTGILAV
jgi:hypothetical protein